MPVKNALTLALSPVPVARYYALVYLTVTGRIVDEIPLLSVPQWTQMIDADGSWQIATQTSTGRKAQLRANSDMWRHSVAICWGTGSSTDYVCQAGPITARQLVTEQPPVLQLGGCGFWPLLRKILQVASTWPGVSLAQAGGADTTYTSSMQGIAVDILTNAVARQSLPLDIPAVIAGTNNRSYYGYELTSAGQRLQELTQVQGGPDVLLKPYLTGTGFVRHQALIGNPTLSTAGRPLMFDYPGNVTGIVPTDDGSNLSTRTYEKGNGVEYASLWSSSTDTTLTGFGWPLLENVDSSHSDVTDQPTLQGWADGTQALTGRPVSTWAVTVDQGDADYPFGSYDPGVTGVYNVLDHCWLPDGQYTQRILGFQGAPTVGDVTHLLQTTVMS
jgi:hypothetical protein